MKVFVSSLIAGMELYREAARDAITTLRYHPVMAEDFEAQPNSPQMACLQGLREADIVVLILGEGYGAVQGSRLSATHEEYEEAKGRKPVFAFVQQGVQRDARQAAFVQEVQHWETGLFRSAFSSPVDLRQAITRALHDYALTNATGPLDQEEMAQRAVSLLPSDRRRRYSGTVSLDLAVAGGPRQTILRPVEIEKPVLAETLIKQALFGEHRLLELASGVEREMEGAALVIKQPEGSRILLDQEGSVCISLPIKRSDGMMPVLIYEAVQEQVHEILSYIAWALETIDPSQRLTHVAIAANISDAEHMTWRTRREHDASPHSMSMGMRNRKESPMQTRQTRDALRLNTAQITEDLVVLLKRQWQ